MKIIAIVIYIEFAAMLIHSGRTASGITWFLSHPFGYGMKMMTGLLTRVALIILATMILF